jgi:hypothetical protein
MYKIDGWCEVYETTDDLIDKGIIAVWDYQNNYYVRVKLNDNYDNRIWIVNKKNHKVSWMAFTDFFEYIDEAKEITPDEFIRAVT